MVHARYDLASPCRSHQSLHCNKMAIEYPPEIESKEHKLL
jgi:hypothetical protein